MTLEDFFSLPELKDGLTTPARVNELVTVMQKEKDCAVKNVSEATRQWSTVASIIAATENKECLDLFIQLDGLWFIDRWLKDALKFANDTGNSFVEESTASLLRALERLQIDNHRSVSSGIGTTVQNLLGHGSPAVQDKAKALCDKWMIVHENDAAPEDVKKLGAHGDDGIECPRAISPSHRNDNEENNIEQSGDQKMQLVSSDTVQQVGDKEETTAEDKIMDTATGKLEPLDPVDSSSISENVGVNLSVAVETPKSKSEGTALAGTSGSSPTVEGTMCDGPVDVSQLDKYVEDAREKQVINSLDKAGSVELSTTPSPLKQEVPSSSADVNNVLESARKTDEGTSDKDEDMVDDGPSSDHCRSTMELNTRNEVGDSSSDDLQVSPDDEYKWGEDENPKMTSDTESDGGSEDVKKHVGIQSEDDSGNDSHFSKPSMNARDGGLTSNRPSDMELDYGMVDPLEVARQVAMEVEREVDSREQSCSTSQNTSTGGMGRPNSPGSANGKGHQSIGGSGKEVSSGPGPSSKALPSGVEPVNGTEPSSKASPSGVEPVNDTETLVSKGESHEPDIAAPLIPEVAQESARNNGRSFSGFDLNQEVSSEEIDCTKNPVLTPISVVSASRAAAAAGLPVAPLQFEGTLGWKGSAATSAFRRIPEVDKTFSSSGSRNNSKQRLDCLDIDLNVAEDSEDKIEDFLSRNQTPITSGFPSGEESSVEASPRRLERLQLDLNSLGDGSPEAVVLDWRRDGRVASLNQNGRQSPSRSSSSSSMQPTLRNIDLNLSDQPGFPNDASLNHPFVGKFFNNPSASGGAYKQGESVISIFGTQVEVRPKDSISQPNGRILDPALDFGLGRTGFGLGLGSSVHYANPPAYGHNGFVSGHAMSFSLPMYGPPGGTVPYMIDSRGAPIVPPIMGPSSFSQPPPPPPPFMMNMAAAGTSSGSNGAGPSRHNIDLNSGLMLEGGNRENGGGLRQFFNARSADEQYLRSSNSLQASSSSVLGGKRPEPDSGWEPFPINYKHQPPPWQ